MKTLVVYDSVFENTATIARAIGEALSGDVQHVRDADPLEASGVDLLVVGSPTQLEVDQRRPSMACSHSSSGRSPKNVAAGLSENIKEQFDKIGVKIATPSGYIGLTFLFFIFVIALFCCSQLAAIREDEAEASSARF